MNKFIYGPVFSWRLGISLGIDLISSLKKMCNYNCVYCQLGNESDLQTERKIFVPTDEVLSEIRALDKNIKIDFMTFSGRGEPTLATNLGEVIRELRKIRPEKIAVITNSSNFYLPEVRKDLREADVVLAKFDICDDEMFRKINRPDSSLSFDKIYSGLKKFREEFVGILEIQIMFTNQNKDSYEKYFEIIKNLSPDRIQINTPLRPCDTKPLNPEEINLIKKSFQIFFKNTKINIVSVYDIEQEDVIGLNKNETEFRRGKK